MSVETSVVTKSVEPLVDTGNLLFINRNPLRFEALKNHTPSDDELLSITNVNTQCLFNEIWKLPRSTYEDATCAELPKTKYALPREKPIPTKAPLTRWEKFAQSNGIKSKTQRDKKVWDNETELWKPRYGYNRGNDNTKDWLIEIPGNRDPNVDYFQQRSEAKKERIAKNQMQRLNNIKNRFNWSDKRHNDGNLQPSFKHKLTTAKGANSVPLGVGTNAWTRDKTELSFKIHHAKQATASAGKFQNKLKGERTPKLGIKRKFEPNEQNIKLERAKQFEILDRMISKKPKINQARINAAAEAVHQNNAEGSGKRHRR